jgi:hypothetical protein
MTFLRSFAALSLLAGLLVACSGETPLPSGATACPPVQVSGPDGQPLDLSGTWSGNDGGLYYIKQVDSCIWWSGLSNFTEQGQYPGQEWVMVFRGSMDSAGIINGDFVDVFSTNPGTGTMTIEARIDPVESGDSQVNLYRTAQTGHEIGVTFWTRVVAPAPTDAPPPPETTGPETAAPETPAPTEAPTAAPTEAPVESASPS